MSAEAKETAAEVGVKLVLNSNAQSEAQHIANGLRKIDGEAKKASDGWKGKFASGMKSLGGLALGGYAAMAAGAAAAGAAVVGFGVHSLHAFEAADEELRSMAGTLMTIDRNANAFEDLHEYADDIKNVLEDIGIEAGVADDKTAAAFTNIIEHGGKTVEETQTLVREMALAGKVIPGGLDSIAMGYEQIQLGMVRAKNPLVQLISATGTLKGNAKDVAKQMQKMSPEEQMKLAEKAVGKFSEKMKDVPLTMKQMGEGMDIVKGNVFEAVGKPILEQVEKGLQPVHKWIVDNQGTLYELGEKFGDGIGKAVEIGSKFAGEAWNAANAIWKEAQSTFEAMYGPGMDLFSYIYDNKDAFAKTFGDIIKDLAHVMITMEQAFLKVRDAIFSAVEAIGKSGIFGDDIARFIGEEQQKNQVADMRKSIFASGGKMGDAEYEKRRSEFVQTAISAGINAEEANADFAKAYRNAMDTHQQIMKQEGIAMEASLNDDAKGFAAAYNAAAKAQDTAVMENIARFLEGNLAMQNAIAKEGPAIFEGGMDSFFNSLKALGDKDIAAYLKDKMKPNLGKPSKTSITQNFNGNITVKQDFRDQDPDRVAVVFKRELSKLGQSRLQSRMAGPFGF